MNRVLDIAISVRPEIATQIADVNLRLFGIHDFIWVDLAASIACNQRRVEVNRTVLTKVAESRRIT